MTAKVVRDWLAGIGSKTLFIAVGLAVQCRPKCNRKALAVLRLLSLLRSLPKNFQMRRYRFSGLPRPRTPWA